MFRTSERLEGLPPYLFAEIDRKKKRLVQEGHDVISLGVGDPDLPTPAYIVDAMREAVGNSRYHQYPFGRGMQAFRNAIARRYGSRWDTRLDPEEEICVLIGSKEGIAHFPLAFLDPGEVSLVPEPGYPVYAIGTLLAGGRPHYLPLKADNGFLPDLGSVPGKVLERARILYLNYPNNPTAAFAPREFLLDAVGFCRRNGLILVYDAAYSEIYFEESPVSFLSLPGARDVGIEFHSLSKTFNMTGWRIGWACGNRELVSALARLKENLDSGAFEAIQEAGISALEAAEETIQELRDVYRRRRDVFAAGLRRSGRSFSLPGGTFYFWVEVPDGDSIRAADELLEKAHIVATPGVGFGPSGQGYLRFSLTLPDERLERAVQRMEETWRKK